MFFSGYSYSQVKLKVTRKLVINLYFLWTVLGFESRKTLVWHNIHLQNIQTDKQFLKSLSKWIISFFFCHNFQQADFDMLLVNLRMDAVFVKENMHISWVAESGIIDNIIPIIKEYKDTRSLQVRQILKFLCFLEFDQFFKITLDVSWWANMYQQKSQIWSILCQSCLVSAISGNPGLYITDATLSQKLLDNNYSQ